MTNMLPATHQHFNRTLLCVGLSAGLGSLCLPSEIQAVEVQNCGDGGVGSGSLRDAILAAGPGDVVDMSELPTKCGLADSTITLLNGELVVPQDNLILRGPSNGSVMITSPNGSTHRIFNHSGVGVLSISNLIIANGKVLLADANSEGGCIRSEGSVLVANSTIRQCNAKATGSGSGWGGAISAPSGVALINSTISGSVASHRGGAIYSLGDVTILNSSIESNRSYGFGGGIEVAHTPGTPTPHVYIDHSSLSDNESSNCAAGVLVGFNAVLNSTISYNTAQVDGGVCMYGPSVVSNSTIAKNYTLSSAGPWTSSGIRVDGSFHLESSIIGLNNGPVGVPDLYARPIWSTTGADNLVTSFGGNVPSNIIVTSADPKLGPSVRTGARTFMLPLLRDSPAIGIGNNYSGSITDQRGRGYPRTTYANYLTDIGAVQFDSIFFGDLDP